jgi:hypothetical protein
MSLLTAEAAYRLLVRREPPGAFVSALLAAP